MRQAYEQIAQVAPTDTTVLIRGESGTGKELIAHAVHYGSLRAKKPFVKLSVASIPTRSSNRSCSGTEKGAFTGALARKRGRFDLAEGGTLFFDEIGELNAAAQVKLLRVLQEHEFQRLGGTETIQATSGSWPRPTRTWRRPSPRGSSARTLLPPERLLDLRAAAPGPEA